MTLTETYTIWAPMLMLVIARLAGMILVAPIFSHSAVPIKIRVIITLAISLSVIPRIYGVANVPTDAGQLLLLSAGEFLIGAVIGYAARLVFVGFQIGAFHIGNQMGLALGEVYSPQSDEAGGIVRAVFSILTIAIFLLIGGHRALIGEVLRTFETLPVASAGVAGPAMLNVVAGLLAASFALALKVAGAVLITMLLATVAMGMLQKAMPQFNLLTTYLPIRAMLGMSVLAASIAALQPLLNGFVEMLINQVNTMAGAGV